MSQNGIAQRGIGQPGDHRNLDCGQGLPRTGTERREPEDAIAISLHEDFINALLSVCYVGGGGGSRTIHPHLDSVTC